MATPKPDQDERARGSSTSSTTAGEGDALSPACLGVSLSGSSDPGPLDAPPGALDQPAEPVIPPDLDAQLNGRERRTVWYMVEGMTYGDALTAAGVPPRAAVRDVAPPTHLVAAVRAVLRQIATRAGLSREWIVTETVALYRRATQAEPVYDRRGRPTGEWKMDGPTAAKCLSMLAEWHPELKAKRPGTLDVGEVASLLRAVAGRGRPDLPARPGRVIEAERAQIGAPQQPGKT